MIGLYKIIFIPDNKEYLGSSINIEKRIKIHKNDLNKNKHHNILLQRYWNKYNPNNFNFITYINCDGYSIKELRNLEYHYLINNDFYFNFIKCAIGGDLITNHPNYDQIIKERSISMQKYFNSLSIEERKYKYGKFQEENGMFGKSHSITTKQQISDKIKEYYKNNKHYLKGKSFEEYFTKEISEYKKQILSSINRVKENNPFFGKEHSDLTKEKIRQSRMNKYHGNQNICFTIDDISYSSLSEASKQLNIPTSTIWFRLKSKNFRNYKYD